MASKLNGVGKKGKAKNSILKKSTTVKAKGKKQVSWEDDDIDEDEVDIEEEVIDEEEENEDLEEEEEPVKKVRRRITIEDHIAHYKTLMDLLDAEIDRKSRGKEKGVRSFQKAKKLLTQMRNELTKLPLSKAARTLASTRKVNGSSGLSNQYRVSEELANFLNIDPETETVSRMDTTRAVCVYIKLNPEEVREPTLKWAHLNPGSKRDLQDPAKKSRIIPDKKLSSLLRYPQYKKDVAKGLITQKQKDRETGIITDIVVEDTGLYYTSLQRLIKHHFIEVVKDEVAKEEDQGEEEEDQDEEEN